MSNMVNEWWANKGVASSAAANSNENRVIGNGLINLIESAALRQAALHICFWLRWLNRPAIQYREGPAGCGRSSVTSPTKLAVRTAPGNPGSPGVAEKMPGQRHRGEVGIGIQWIQ